MVAICRISIHVALGILGPIIHRPVRKDNFIDLLPTNTCVPVSSMRHEPDKNSDAHDIVRISHHAAAVPYKTSI